MEFKSLNKKAMYSRIFKQGFLDKLPSYPLQKNQLSLRFINSLEENDFRSGFLLRKKTGNAVLRNRLRRILKDCLHKQAPKLSKSLWILFDVAPQPLQISLKEFRLEAQKLLQNLSQKYISC